MGKQFGICGNTHFEYLTSALQAHQRVSSGDDGIGSKHDHLMYRGRKFYFGNGVNFSGETDLADDQTYLICPGAGKLQICFHKDANFAFLEPVSARNQDAISRLMILMVGMTVGNRKIQATGFDS